MNTVLNFLSSHDRRCFLMRYEVRLLGKVGRRIWVSFHGKIVQDQGVDVTIDLVSNC